MTLLVPHSVPMQSMKTAIGTIALSAPATPTSATTHAGSSCVTMVSSARSLVSRFGTTNSAAMPSITGTSSSSEYIGRKIALRRIVFGLLEPR